MKHLLPALPYTTNALEPFISAETLEYHYSVHHDCYVLKLNEVVSNTRYAEMSLEEIIGRAPAGPICNNAVQCWNHAFYWRCMSADGGGVPDQVLSDAINQWFGSLERFKQAFEKACLGMIGSGWAWLVLEPNGRLAISALKSAGKNPLSYGQQPLLACDLWEHAYYLDHRNQRTRYLSAFWNLINWGFVCANFAHPAQIEQTRAYRYPELAPPYREPGEPNRPGSLTAISTSKDT